MTKELEGLKKGPKSWNTFRFTQNGTKKIQLENAGHDRIHGFWLKKFTSIHDRLGKEMNRRLQRSLLSEWMTKGKTTLIQKDPSKGTAPSNCRSMTCLPMTRKILTAQKGRDLQLANKPRIVPWRAERMLQKILWHRRVTLQRATHPKWEQDQT